ncbi:MAG: cpaB [Acidimicrobiales bacterium]|nr:cpaB [Acidimicrobiales bacterium]
MRQRSNLVVVLGVSVFVLGVAATFLILRNDNNSSSGGGGKVAVLYAKGNIAAGTSGSTAYSTGLIETRQIAASNRPPGALTLPTELTGKSATHGIAAGSALTVDQFTVPQTVIGSLPAIPAGKQAVAVQLAKVPGVAGFAGAGDTIDIFAVTKVPDRSGAQTRLVMQGIQVLSVNGTTLASAPGQPGGDGLVFLLAVAPEQAERLVYLTNFESLYFSLLPKNQAAVPGTPGAGAPTALIPVG